MPRPGSGEKKSDFISRCIPTALEDGTADDQEQAAAICYSMWDESKEASESVKVKKTDKKKPQDSQKKETQESLYAQKTKGAAKYRKPDEGSASLCKACRFFSPEMDWIDGDYVEVTDRAGRCALVEGDIEPLYTCGLFEPVGEPALEHTTEPQGVVGLEASAGNPEVVDLGDAKFSLKKASTIKSSELPQTAFLVVGNAESRSSWHMPIRDADGVYNVGFLNAAHTLVCERSLRGIKPGFEITQSIEAEVKRLWSLWRNKGRAKVNAVTATAAEGIANLRYIANPATIGQTSKNPSVASSALCEGVLQEFIWRNISEATSHDGQPVIRCVVENIDTVKREATIIAIEEGWSLNKSVNGLPRFYQKTAVKDVAEALQERPNIFDEHVIGTDRKTQMLKLNRPMRECVCIVVKRDGIRQAWYEETAEGIGQAKARVRFTNYPPGKSAWAEVLEDAESVQFSINARTLVIPKKEVQGVMAESVEGCNLLYSVDKVGYAAAKGRIDQAYAVEQQDASESEFFEQAEVCEGAYFIHGNPKSIKESETTMRYQFETVEEALSNEELLTGFKEKLNVEALTKENANLKQKNTELETAAESHRKEARKRSIKDLIDSKIRAIRQDKKVNLPNFEVSESFYADALLLQDDELPDNYAELTEADKSRYKSVSQKIDERLNERLELVRQAAEAAARPRQARQGAVERRARSEVRIGEAVGQEEKEGAEQQVGTAEVQEHRRRAVSVFKRRGRHIAT